MASLMFTLLFAAMQPLANGNGEIEPSTGDKNVKVVSVEVELPPGMELKDVDALISVEKGSSLSLKKVRKSLVRLFKLDLFERIRVYAIPVEGGMAVKFECLPKKVISSIEIAGNKRFSDEKILRLLRIRAGDDFVLDEVERRVDAVQYAYKRAGYHYARVLFDPVDNGKGVKLLIRIIEGKPLVVRRILITGNTGVPKSKVLDNMETGEGDVLDLDVLEKDRKRIRSFYQDMGRYDAQVGDPSLEIDRKSYMVTVRLRIEAGPVIHFAFDGNREISSSVLKKLLEPEKEERISKTVIDNMASQIKSYYTKLGYMDAQVSGTRKRTGPDSETVVFDIHEGKRVRIAKILFTGNQAVSDSKLVKLVETVLESENKRPLLYQPVDPDLLTKERLTAAGVGSRDSFREPLPGREVYTEEAFKSGLEEVANYYRSLGYLSVDVDQPVLQRSKDGTRLYITVHIIEGRRTMTGTVELRGWPAVDEVEEIESSLLPPEYSGLNPWRAEEAVKNLRELCRSKGYYFCKVERRDSRSGNTVNITYRVDPGPLVRIGEIIVRGNRDTGSSLIRERMTVRSGDLLVEEELKRSRQRLIRTGLFTQVSVDIFEPDRLEPVKNLVVKVREAPGSILEAAGGINSEKGPLLRISFERKNLAHVGVRGRMAASINYPMVYFLDQQFQDFLDQLPIKDRIEREITLSVTHPYLLVTREFQLGLRGDVALLVRDNHPAYGLDEQRAGISLFTDPYERMTGALEFEFVYDDVQLAAGTRGGGDIPPEGISWSYGPRARVVLDLRDDRFDPTKGFLFSLSGEYKRSLPELNKEVDVNFVKGEIVLNGYLPLHAPSKLRLAASLRVGAIKNFSKTNPTPVQDRFFLGGRTDLRSLPEKTLYPADMTIEEVTARGMDRSEGGNVYFTLKLELRRKLFWGFEFGLFLDMGNLWIDPSLGDLLDARYAAGFGLRYSTPVGPIAFDYGFNLDRKKEFGEPVGAFHFSIGIF